MNLQLDLVLVLVLTESSLIIRDFTAQCVASLLAMFAVDA